VSPQRGTHRFRRSDAGFLPWGLSSGCLAGLGACPRAPKQSGHPCLARRSLSWGRPHSTSREQPIPHPADVDRRSHAEGIGCRRVPVRRSLSVAAWPRSGSWTPTQSPPPVSVSRLALIQQVIVRTPKRCHSFNDGWQVYPKPNPFEVQRSCAVKPRYRLIIGSGR
jgi:hypothetical protein